MAESDSKKTLSLPKTTPDASARSGARRQASGARAHRQVRQTLEQQKTQREAPEVAAPTKPAAKTFSQRPAKARHTDPARAATRQPRARSLPKEMLNPYEGRHKAFASCPRGLEAVLAEELKALALGNVQAGSAGVHFEAPWSGIQEANLQSRLATRILVQVAQADVQTEADISELALATAWEKWFGPDHTLRVDTSAIRSPMKSLQYCNLLVKDGICDRLRDREGARPSIDTVRPDARVHLFLSATTATLYLDTSGESLFKRGWRFDKGAAPIRENLAAGLLALSGWTPQIPLLDPFCGSGTILIEAAWIALNIPPGINRPFAFERLRHHDAAQWQARRHSATESILPTTDAVLTGFDLDTVSIDNSGRNLHRANVPAGVVALRQADACQEPALGASGLILTNPPYGLRLDYEAELMQCWATHLKQAYGGWEIGVISADLELPRTMRLKAKRRIPVFNGALDCRLFLFDLVSGQYRD